MIFLLLILNLGYIKPITIDGNMGLIDHAIYTPSFSPVNLLIRYTVRPQGISSLPSDPINRPEARRSLPTSKRDKQLLTDKGGISSSCLALPSVYFHDPESIEEWIRQYHILKDWIHERYPDASILITHISNPPREPGWQRLPILFDNCHVWIKPKPKYLMKEGA